MSDVPMSSALPLIPNLAFQPVDRTIFMRGRSKSSAVVTIYASAAACSAEPSMW